MKPTVAPVPLPFRRPAVALPALLLALVAVALPARAAEWRVVQQEGRWSLQRDGAPFFIQGAVAPDRFAELRAAGANAARVNATRANLDAAHAAGLFVMANLTVRAERSGMDWGNRDHIAQQEAQVVRIVQELKDHPALMLWSLGNELDHIPGRKDYNEQLWPGLAQLARAVKAADPRHPLLTVVGTGRFAEKLPLIAAHGEPFDLLGINSYGDLGKATALARQHWPKPYLIAEWGPTGHWEMPKTRARAPVEQTSSEKAAAIAERYRSYIAGDRTHCVGSFAFYWSERQETTHTWYGLFLQGLRTESIDVLQHLWTGAWPANRAPALRSLRLVGFSDPRTIALRPGATHRVEVEAADPEGDSLQYHWDVRPEVVIPPGSYAGAGEKRTSPIAGLVASPAAPQTAFTAPSEPGAYRVFVTITDGKGQIAYGNLPFEVTRE